MNILTNQLFKEPLTDTQRWSITMFTYSLRVLIAAVITVIISVLAMIYLFAG